MANLKQSFERRFVRKGRKLLLASCFAFFTFCPLIASAQNNVNTSIDAPLVPLLKPEDKQLLINAYNNPARIGRNRDIYRHPVETLEFFGVRPSDTVIEIWPGQGWYSSILGPYLKSGNGRLIAAHFDTSTTNSPIVKQVVDTYSYKYGANTNDYGNVNIVPFGPRSPQLAPKNSVDSILTFRNAHNWMAQGWAEKAFEDFFAALKPGGILGIEEHRQDESVPQDPLAADGYVREDFIIDLATEAGFELVAKSEINANPKDTKDHPFGVWTLPPVSRSAPMGQPENPDFDKRPFLKIGESDRMTLVFRKPIPKEPIEIIKSIPQKIAGGVRMFGPGSKSAKTKENRVIAEANNAPSKPIENENAPIIVEAKAEPVKITPLITPPKTPPAIIPETPVKIATNEAPGQLPNFQVPVVKSAPYTEAITKAPEETIIKQAEAPKKANVKPPAPAIKSEPKATKPSISTNTSKAKPEVKKPAIVENAKPKASNSTSTKPVEKVAKPVIPATKKPVTKSKTKTTETDAPKTKAKTVTTPASKAKAKTAPKAAPKASTKAAPKAAKSSNPNAAYWVPKKKEK